MRTLPAQALAIADEAGRTAYHLVAPYLLPVLERGLRTVDGYSKSYLGYDTRLHHSSRNIWT